MSQMLRLPVIKLPNEFTNLLKIKIYNADESVDNIIRYIYDDKFLTNLVGNCFKEFDSEKKIKKIIISLGWKHFRDRLASVYIHKAIFNSYPKSTDIHITNELQLFEENFERFSLKTNSRSFLLAFYLKFLEIKLREEGQTLKILEIIDEAKEFLDLSTARQSKIDWLILLAWHVAVFIGVDQLKVLYKAKKLNFADVFDRFSEEQKRTLIDNFLSYGCSIGEDEMFLFEKV
jgi:hypothetical protein